MPATLARILGRVGTRAGALAEELADLAVPGALMLCALVGFENSLGTMRDVCDAGVAEAAIKGTLDKSVVAQPLIIENLMGIGPLALRMQGSSDPLPKRCTGLVAPLGCKPKQCCVLCGQIANFGLLHQQALLRWEA